MTADPHLNLIYTSALDAWDAGLSVIPVRTDGTKRPVGEWKQYQTQRASRHTVNQWFHNTPNGLGIICGAVSGDLEMLELEGRFINEIGTEAFKQAAKAANLGLLLSRLVNGFMVISPSNGRHFYYRVNGEAAPNTKLARQPGLDKDGKPTLDVLIETRGEGGFVVAPPSGGTVHPTGRSWQTKATSWTAIPTITLNERQQLFELCRTFDNTPATTPTPATPHHNPIRIQPPTSRPNSSSWMDTLTDHLRTQPATQLLEHYGWTIAYTDKHGRTLMTRPGKTEGVSGSINTNGRFLPFSTSTPFATGGNPPTTYDQLDIIAAYEHRGDRKTAARQLATQLGILTPPAAPPTPATRINTDTGEIIPDTPYGHTFWNSRPVLQHIHQAALSRMVAPAAVLAATLARIAAFTPPSTCLPPIIGTSSTLSSYFALYAPSGGGKSSALGCAHDLLPDTPAGCIGPLGVGSGEGIVDTFFEYIDETDDNGKKIRTKKQTRHGALFNLDEGQALTEMGSRRGSTILPILRTAWSGADLGQANASQETRRNLPAGSYSIGLMSGWQTRAAAQLMEDADGGTPQRIVWANTIDPTITINPPDWPGPITWTPPAHIKLGNITMRDPLDVHPHIINDIRQHHVNIQTGTTTIDPLDAHRRLATLKIAGLLTVLDQRRNITLDDWQLAETVMQASNNIRNWIVAESRREASQRDEHAANRQARREAVVEAHAYERALEQAAKAIQRVAAKGEPIKRRDVNQAMNSRTRQMVTVDDAITEAVKRGWITPAGDGTWQAATTKSA